MTSDQLTIRPAVPDDLETINAIITRAIQGWTLPERVKRLTLSSLQYSLTDLEFQSLWVALSGQKPVGMVAWEVTNSADSIDQTPYLLLHGIYVDPKTQGRGVGKALYKKAEITAREKGLARIVVKAQKGSEAFYKAMGLSPMPVNDASRDFENRFAKSLANAN